MTSLKITYGTNEQVIISNDMLGTNGRISLTQNIISTTFTVMTDIMLALRDKYKEIADKKITNITFINEDTEILNFETTSYDFEVNWKVDCTSRFYQEVISINCTVKN